MAKIEQVNSYKYLGSVVESKGNVDEDLNKGIHAAKGVYYALARKFLHRMETKLATYKSMYLPVLLNRRGRRRIGHC